MFGALPVVGLVLLLDGVSCSILFLKRTMGYLMWVSFEI